MTEYQIRPLVVAKIGAVKGVATHMVDMMTPVVVPVLAFYLEGGSKKILVDTGVVDGGPEGNFHGFPRNRLRNPGYDQCAGRNRTQT